MSGFFLYFAICHKRNILTWWIVTQCGNGWIDSIDFYTYNILAPLYLDQLAFSKYKFSCVIVPRSVWQMFVNIIANVKIVLVFLGSWVLERKHYLCPLTHILTGWYETNKGKYTILSTQLLLFVIGGLSFGTENCNHLRKTWSLFYTIFMQIGLAYAL